MSDARRRKSPDRPVIDDRAADAGGLRIDPGAATRDKDADIRRMNAGAGLVDDVAVGPTSIAAGEPLLKIADSDGYCATILLVSATNRERIVSAGRRKLPPCPAKIHSKG